MIWGLNSSFRGMALEKPFPVSQSLYSADSQLEQVWEKVFDIAQGPWESTPFLRSVSTRRVLSYNPGNRSLNADPKIHSAVAAITRVIDRCMADLSRLPDTTDRFISLGHCYLLLNDFPNAYACYARVLQVRSEVDSPYFWYAVACVYHHFSYNGDAVKFMGRALLLAPQFHHGPDLYLRYAIILRTVGDYDRSIDFLERLVATPPAGLKEDDIRFQVAYTRQIAGQHDRAAVIYRDLLSRHSTVIEVVQQYCWALSLRPDAGSWHLAEQILQHSDPSDPVLRLIVARLAMKQQDMPTAYQRYCDCINYWSDSPLFWAGLGVLYFKNEQMQDAIVAFQRALQLKAELCEVWANLGLICELANDTQNAAMVYQNGLRHCRDSKLLSDRLNSLSSGRSKGQDQVGVIEVNHATCFVQVAERVGLDYMSDTPSIPASVIGIEDANEEVLAELLPPHRSLF